VNIPAALESIPVWLRRHLLVKCLLVAFPKAHDQWIRFNGRAKAFVDLRDPETRNVFLKQSFDPDFFEIARRVLSEGGVFLDCGANFGLCTFGLLPLVDSSRLSCYLFEANPNLIRYLEKSKSLFPSIPIKIIEGCLADRPGTSRFRINPEFTGHSHVALDGATIRQNVVLDDYLDQNNIDRVTFLKLDLEGQELKTLRGAARALDRAAIEVIYFEVRSELLRRYDVTGDQVLEFMRENSFRVFYCRDRDLLERPATQVRFVRHDLNQRRLAEVESVDDWLQTDLLAVHETQMVTP
jgi:FkbM family methyltransferase